MYAVTEETMVLSRQKEEQPLYLSSQDTRTSNRLREPVTEMTMTTEVTGNRLREPVTEMRMQDTSYLSSQSLPAEYESNPLRSPPASYASEYSVDAVPGTYAEQPVATVTYAEQPVATVTYEQPIAQVTYEQSSDPVIAAQSPTYQAWVDAGRPRTVQVSCPGVRPVSVLTELRYDADPDTFDAYPVVYPQFTKLCPNLPVNVGCMCK